MLIGTMYKVQDTWGMCFASEDNFSGNEPVDTSIAVGKVVSIIYHAEKILVAKATSTGSAIEVGDFVYIDPTTKLSSKTKDGVDDECIGVCVENAADADSFVEIDLRGASMNDMP